MAYNLEKYFYNSNDYEGCFPYAACDKVYEYIMGKPCDDTVIIIALSYASLMNKNPGNTFIDILTKAKEKEICFECAESVFSFAKDIRYVSEIQLDILDNTIDQLFPTKIATAIYTKTGDDLAKNVIYTNKWLKKQYRFICEHEDEYRKAFFTILEEYDIETGLRMMFELLNQYGQPLIFDKNGKLYPEEEKELVSLLAPWALHHIICGKRKGCTLIPICTQYKMNITAECTSDCWNRKESICILKFYIIIMGLIGIDFSD